MANYAQQTYAIGAASNDGNGDPHRDGVNKFNENFGQLFASFTLDSTTDALNADIAFTNNIAINFFDAGGTERLAIRWDGSDDFRIGGANDTLSLYSGGARRFQTDANGNVVVGTGALATTATDGFLYIPTSAGTPTGIPTTKTGRVAIIFDTTNNKIYVYDGSWLATAALT